VTHQPTYVFRWPYHGRLHGDCGVKRPHNIGGQRQIARPSAHVRAGRTTNGEGSGSDTVGTPYGVSDTPWAAAAARTTRGSLIHMYIFPFEKSIPGDPAVGRPGQDDQHVVHDHASTTRLQLMWVASCDSKSRDRTGADSWPAAALPTTPPVPDPTTGYICIHIRRHSGVLLQYSERVVKN
jgi:hypothetical protein